MAILNELEKVQCAADVREMILASEQTATVLRRTSGEKLFGHDEEIFEPVSTIPLELNPTPPVNLPGEIDAVASALPTADVHAEDRLKIGGETYRVQTVVEERLFGVVTHKVLRLVALHGR